MSLAAGFGNSRRGKRALSSTVGYVLIFAMILGAVTVIVTIGGAAITDAQAQTEMERAEHSMTLFDSRAAMVALGESRTQSVSFGQDSGSFETRPDAGHITIKHVEYETGANQEVFSKSLGAMVYENGHKELAYQGGGVWRLDREGGARMVSPPEFHYRGATLTLPIIRIQGASSGAGSVTSQMSAATQAQKVYPNMSAVYDSNSRRFLNPIENGTIHVYVESEYYRGWADYFRKGTSGNVTVFDSNQTARVELLSLGGSPGEFPMPLEGQSLAVGGFGDDHPIQDFELTLKADGNFNNGHWSFYNSDGNDEFEMHIYSEGKCQNDGTYNKKIDFSLYYYNDSTGEVQEWQNSSIDPNDSDTAFDIDCDSKELTVDFTSTNTNLTYKDIDLTGTDNKWCYGDHIDARPADSTITPDQHNSSDYNREFNEGNESATMKWVVNHYTERLGVNYDLTVKDGPGNSDCLSGGSGSGSSRMDESSSSGVLRYDEAEGGQYITYLHVTENQINVTYE